MKGNVKFFNNMKGFGFIAGEDGKEYFVHQSDIAQGVELNEDDSVNFEIEEGDRGPKAAKVNLSSEEETPAEESEEEKTEEEAPVEESEEETPVEETEEEAPAEKSEEETPVEETEEEKPAE
jgi:cold shock protein